MLPNTWTRAECCKFYFHGWTINKLQVSDADVTKLLELGSCSLHTVHGALPSRLQKSGWELDRLLQALFYLFDRAPARQEDYTVNTKSQVFSLQFCSTGWFEDMSVAERAIGIWPDVVKYVTEMQMKKIFQIPTSTVSKVLPVVPRMTHWLLPSWRHLFHLPDCWNHFW